MYTFESRVRFSETDEKDLLSVPGIVDYFQDTSTFQSEDLGLGVGYLRNKDLVWVVNAWQIVICRRPALGERIRLGTLPYEFKGFLGLRNFLMEDAAGNRLAAANSIWTLLNPKTGLPARPTAEMYKRYALEPRLEMDYAPRKIALPPNGVEKERFFISRQHLDSNHHVNNGQYVHMAMEYLPPGFSVGQLRAEYKRQAHLGDEMVPVLYEQDKKVITALNGADGLPYAVVEFSPA